jgi:hypothetical protein
VLSKLLERLVAGQLNNYLSSADLLPPLQSGFRPNYSTETAVLRVLSDILLAVDRGDFAALTLLDLTAAFDTVDHGILLQRLRITFGIDDAALKWFRSYLLGRTQRVCRGVTRSSIVQLVCGLPQGSVLGPILFILYTADLIALIERLGLTPHLYADDIQIYGACSPSGTEISNCAVDVAAWLRFNRLQMNDAKTEFMWFTTCRRLHRLPTSGPAFGSVSIPPSTAVRDLGIFVDSDLSMRTHVQRTVSRCFAAIRQLRSIRRYVPVSVFQSLVVSLVLSRLDYGNSVLVGLPACLLRRLQSVQNAAARLIFRLRRSDHITDALLSLHWLRVPERITFKVAVLTYRALHGTAPRYLSSQLTRTADAPNRRGLRSAASDRLIVPRCRLQSIGSRSFPIAAATIWNELPAHITSAESLPIFRQRLKTHLFRSSYPNIFFQ